MFHHGLNQTDLASTSALSNPVYGRGLGGGNGGRGWPGRWPGERRRYQQELRLRPRLPLYSLHADGHQSVAQEIVSLKKLTRRKLYYSSFRICRETRAGNNLYQELSFQDSDALADIDEGADLTGNRSHVLGEVFELNLDVLLSRRVGASKWICILGLVKPCYWSWYILFKPFWRLPVLFRMCLTFFYFIFTLFLLFFH